MKYKIGDILKIKKGFTEEVCGNYRDYKGCFIKITDCDGGYDYDILDKDKIKVANCCGCFKDIHLDTLEKTWDNLEVGDIIVNQGEEAKILEVLSNSFLRSNRGDFSKTGGWYTPKEAQNDGWKIKQDPIVEVETVEIAGKKYSKEEFEKAVKDLKEIEIEL
jgi:hypothetical protein